MTNSGRPLRIALAITALYGVSGGAERVLVDVANGLHRRGHDVSVLTYQVSNGPSFYPLDYGIRRFDGRQREGRSHGVDLTSLSGVARRRRSVGIVTWLARYTPRMLRSRRMLRIADPDLVIAFLPSSFPYMTVAAVGTGIPVVASIHNVPWRELGGDPERWDQNPVDISVRRWALRRCGAITVLLDSFREQLDTDLHAKTSVLPNPVEPSTTGVASVDDSAENEVLTVGRLYPAKDHATLIRAWAIVEPLHPNWRLRIVGEGPLGPELEALIDELELERVQIDPPRTDIEQAYTAASLFVLPSRFEGFGLVTVEAMAHGLPTVGFADCDGTNEVIEHGTSGVLVEPGTDRVAALADGLQRLMGDEAERRRLAANGPASATRFAPDRVIDAWEQLGYEVASSTSGSRHRLLQLVRFPRRRAR